jgi:hypothetical protein
MGQNIDTESLVWAARRFQDAAVEATRAADRLEQVLPRFKVMTEDGCYLPMNKFTGLSET